MSHIAPAYGPEQMVIETRMERALRSVTDLSDAAARAAAYEAAGIPSEQIITDMDKRAILNAQIYRQSIKRPDDRQAENELGQLVLERTLRRFQASIEGRNSKRREACKPYRD